MSDYDEAIRLDTGNALAHVDRGVLIATRKAELRKAIGDFDHALALVPNNVDTLVLRGNAYTSVGEHGRALADLNRAVALAPDNPRAFMVRGLVNARLGDMQRAFADYNRALSIDPEYVDALVNRAAIYSMQGNIDEALADLDQALERQPRHALANYNRVMPTSPDRNTIRPSQITAAPSRPMLGWAGPSTTAASPAWSSAGT